MEFRRLGDSDIEVSEISLGSWLTYSGGVERDQAEACTRAAFEHVYEMKDGKIARLENKVDQDAWTAAWS